MKEILLYFLVLNLGFFLGYITRVWMAHRFANYSGTIFVTKNREKTLYSLELNEYPDELRFKKEVAFKIDASKFSELSEIDSPG